MKLRALSFLCALALTGCGEVAKVNTVTATDLTNAIGIDKATNNTEKLACDTWIQSQLTTIQTAAANTPKVTGIFSATSAVDGATTSILTAVGPSGQQAFEVACGPWVLHLAGTVTGFKAAAAAAPGVVSALGIKF